MYFFSGLATFASVLFIRRTLVDTIIYVKQIEVLLVGISTPPVGLCAAAWKSPALHSCIFDYGSRHVVLFDSTNYICNAEERHSSAVSFTKLTLWGPYRGRWSQVCQAC